MHTETTNGTNGTHTTTRRGKKAAAAADGTTKVRKARKANPAKAIAKVISALHSIEADLTTVSVSTTEQLAELFSAAENIRDASRAVLNSRLDTIKKIVEVDTDTTNN